MLGTANRPRTRESGRGLCRGVISGRHRGSMLPSTSRAAEAAPPPASSARSAHTLRVARGPVPHTVAGALQHRPEQSWPSHWLRCWQVHGRATSEKMASQDSHERPVPPPPALAQRGPHLSCPRAAHLHEGLAPSCRQDGAAEGARSDAMDVDSTIEARPHAHPPLRRPAPPAPPPALLRTQRR